MASKKNGFQRCPKPQYDYAFFFHNNIAIVYNKELLFFINNNNQPISKGYIHIQSNENSNLSKCYIIQDKDSIFYLDMWGSKSDSICNCDQVIEENYYVDSLVKDTLIGDALFYYFTNDPKKKIYGDLIWTVDEEGFQNFYRTQTNNLWGLVYNDGKNIFRVLENKFQEIDFIIVNGEKLYPSKINNKWGIESETKTIIPYKYDKILTSYNNRRDNIFYIENDDGKIGYVNLNGFEYFED